MRRVAIATSKPFFTVGSLGKVSGALISGVKKAHNIQIPEWVIWPFMCKNQIIDFTLCWAL